ncbi:response regulator [Aestuariicoccus sp. MJ-SS9]|uniref:response regulator n=1 Tax=Aestuariicoccus sp. MJ-SS9 TaxID=3079855 RepID=UPI00290BD8FC|nr:response regulator [Aestuariicoccus sp. MJ-SS9]MDU8910075.1 response regulator [Aestuariicoccus sp. MJ-SS9]
MDDTTAFDPMPRPTATRPLLGLTVLVVEDSRYACDAMRLLCLRSGARIRRADSLKAGRRHLQVYRPSVLIVDMGLPDGSGADLIAELDTYVPRVSVILGISGDPEAEAAAIAAGADGFLEKPISSLSMFQNKVIGALPPDRRPKGAREVRDDPIFPDPLAFRDDMAHVADVLGDHADNRTLDYVAQFLRGVAGSAGDTDLQSAVESLARARANGKPLQSDIARIAGLVQDRLSERVAV